jgi:hypothetical protein
VKSAAANPKIKMSDVYMVILIIVDSLSSHWPVSMNIGKITDVYLGSEEKLPANVGIIKLNTRNTQ